MHRTVLAEKFIHLGIGGSKGQVAYIKLLHFVRLHQPARPVIASLRAARPSGIKPARFIFIRQSAGVHSPPVGESWTRSRRGYLLKDRRHWRDRNFPCHMTTIARPSFYREHSHPAANRQRIHASRWNRRSVQRILITLLSPQVLSVQTVKRNSPSLTRGADPSPPFPLIPNSPRQKIFVARQPVAVHRRICHTWWDPFEETLRQGSHCTLPSA